MHPILQRWNREYFRGQLSDQALEHLVRLDFDNRELTDFLDVHFRWLHRSGFDPHDFTPQAGQWYETETLDYLPSALEIIPPITIKDRLAEVDDYVLSQRTTTEGSPWCMLDIGCGYPPYTTLEFADKFRNCAVDAIDPNLPAYILFDHHRDHAACFNEEKELVFLQCANASVLNEQRQEIREGLAAEWNEIKTHLQDNDAYIHELKEAGRLIMDPMTAFARENVRFHAEAFADFRSERKYDLIRCFGVLLYYDREFYMDFLVGINRTLVDGGTFLHGIVDPFHAKQVHYVEVEKRSDGLLQKTLAFSISHISPLLNTYAWVFHGNNPDSLLLVRLLKLINSDRRFYDAYVKRFDHLLDTAELATRDSRGYRSALPGLWTKEAKQQLQDICEEMLREFGDELIGLLGRHGICATINPVGHIGVDLPSLPTRYAELLD